MRPVGREPVVAQEDSSPLDAVLTDQAILLEPHTKPLPGTYTGKPFSDRSRGVDFFASRDERRQVVNSQMTTITP